MILVIAAIMILIGLIVGMEVNAATGFITAVSGVALVYLWNPIVKLFKGE